MNYGVAVFVCLAVMNRTSCSGAIHFVPARRSASLILQLNTSYGRNKSSLFSRQFHRVYSRFFTAFPSASFPDHGRARLVRFFFYRFSLFFWPSYLLLFFFNTEVPTRNVIGQGRTNQKNQLSQNRALFSLRFYLT